MVSFCLPGDWSADQLLRSVDLSVDHLRNTAFAFPDKMEIVKSANESIVYTTVSNDLGDRICCNVVWEMAMVFCPWARESLPECI